MDWTNTTARQDEKHSSFRIWRVLYSKFDGRGTLCPKMAVSWLDPYGELAIVQRGIHFNYDTTDSRYIAAQYNTILHPAQQLRM